MSLAIPKITIEGAPRERGRQYGEQARGQIAESLQTYLAAFARAGLDGAAVRERARGFLPKVEAFDGGMVEELRGIAEGAGVEFEQVLALNARTELLFGTPPRPECTVVAALPPASDGRTIIAQNWDWMPEARGFTIVLEVRPDDGPAMLIFVEAGMLARNGLNSAGIGVCGNFLQSDQDGHRSGIPIPFIRRRILMARHYSQAIRTLLTAERAFSSNYLIADAAGEAIDFEALPDDVLTVYPEDGLIVHTNHFLALNGLARDTGKILFPDSLYRHRRAAAHLHPRRGRIGVADVQSALRDHFGHPNSVCRHVDDSPDNPLACTTVASVVADLTNRELHISAGPPCEAEYTTYGFGPLTSESRRTPLLTA